MIYMVFNCWGNKITIYQHKKTCRDLSLNPRNFKYDDSDVQYVQFSRDCFDANIPKIIVATIYR